MRNHPFPLRDLVRRLAENPTMDGAAFGETFVSTAFESTSHRILTLSCVRASALAAVATALDELGRTLSSLELLDGDAWTDERHSMLEGLAACRASAIPMGSGKYVDLHALATALDGWARTAGHDGVRRACTAVKAAVERAVLVTRSRKRCEGAGGLSVFFPEVQRPGMIARMRGRPPFEAPALLVQYERTEFAAESCWDEFLRKLLHLAWDRL